MFKHLKLSTLLKEWVYLTPTVIKQKKYQQQRYKCYNVSRFLL